MAIRRIASYLGATAGALALALAPTVAHAAPFNHIEVGGVTPPAAGTAFTAVGKAPITATIPGFGTITCTSATAGGVVRPANLKFTALSLACPSILPGTSAVIAINSSSAKCPDGIVFTPTATQTVTKMASATNPTGYAGPYNTAVTGTTYFGDAVIRPPATLPEKCIKVDFKIGSTTVCSFKLFGSVGSTFNETPKGTKPAISQQFNLAGSLTVNEVSGACPGISNGLLITLSVPLNLTVPGTTNPRLIDFTP